MEQRFGYDFSRVRVHSGAAAEQSAREVNAQAYTAGQKVVFGADRYTPGTHDEQRLIAHELAHVVQQDGNHATTAAMQREVVTTGTIPMVRFTIDREVKDYLAYKVWTLTQSGPLEDKDMALLRALALDEDKTIDDNERMFLAALYDPNNARKLHAQYPAQFVQTGDVIEFPASSITAANRARVRDFERRKPIQVPGGTTAKPGNAKQIAADLEDEITAISGQFVDTTRQVLKLADTMGITHRVVYDAMLNAASDSTPGDRALGGAAYIMARLANLLPLADDLLHGWIKVDEVSPVKMPRVRGVYALAIYVSEGNEQFKGDTLYLPSDLDFSNIASQGILVHELTHALNDRAVTGLTEVQRVPEEESAMRREARFYLDSILPLSGAKRLNAVQQLGQKVGKVGILCMVLEANIAPIADYSDFAQIIKEVNDIAKPLPPSELNKALRDPQADVEKAARKGISDLYSGASAKIKQAGLVGESVLDTPTR